VHTADNYQRRGFALLTASALIEECLRRGKQPIGNVSGIMDHPQPWRAN
jgi:hypothetical protein